MGKGLEVNQQMEGALFHNPADPPSATLCVLFPLLEYKPESGLPTSSLDRGVRICDPRVPKSCRKQKSSIDEEAWLNP